MKLFSRKPKIDPAMARYPAAMAVLLGLGVTDEEIDYVSLAEQVPGIHARPDPPGAG